MLDAVDATDLGVLVHPEPDGQVDELRDDERDHERHDHHRDRGRGLRPQLAGAAAVDEAVHTSRRICGGEHADEDGAHQATDQVHADHIEGVVVLPRVLQAHRQRTQHTGDRADDDRADRAHRGAGRGDGDQAGHDAGGGTQAGGMAVADLLRQQPAQHRRTGGHDGVQEDHCSGVVGGIGGPGVEAEPAEPQQPGAQHDQREVVGPHRGLGPAEAATQDQCQGQRCGAGVDMHRGATGEVDRADIVEDEATLADPAAAPHPVRHREVDQGHPDTGEQQPGAELRTVGDRTGDQAGGDSREEQLEGDISHHGELGGRIIGHEPIEAEVGGRAAEEAPRHGIAVGHRVPVDDPDDADEAERPHHHHQHVEHALGPRHAPIENRKTGDHHQDQGGTGQQPSGVARVQGNVFHRRFSHPELIEHGNRAAAVFLEVSAAVTARCPTGPLC